jgi:hypothetical protein
MALHSEFIGLRVRNNIEYGKVSLMRDLSETCARHNFELCDGRE